MSQEQRSAAISRAAQRITRPGESAGEILAALWDEAFEQGKLAALDELSDRFCVCMK